jgi:hypothetical protein
LFDRIGVHLRAAQPGRFILASQPNQIDGVHTIEIVGESTVTVEIGFPFVLAPSVR